VQVDGHVDPAWKYVVQRGQRSRVDDLVNRPRKDRERGKCFRDGKHPAVVRESVGQRLQRR
jgi:hypothetical protein